MILTRRDFDFRYVTTTTTLARMSERDGLSKAIEAKLSGYVAMVRQIGRRHGLEENELEEVLQEVRVRLWKALGSSEKIRRISTSYVYRTAVSAALDLMRRRRAYAVQLADPRQASSEAALIYTPTPERDMEHSELRSELEMVISSLSDSRRPVVRMYLSGYSREEIASLLGWTEARTRMQLYRGLADLRSRLDELGIRPESVT